MITFDGKCSGRRLRVTINSDTVTIESLSGQQAGSIFTHTLAELKRKPDVVVDSDTPRHGFGMIAGILAAIVGLLCAAHWGEGVTIGCFWACMTIVAIAIVVVRSAPKKKTFLWSTKSGVQAFGLEENQKNQEELRLFLTSLEASVAAQK